MSAGLFFGLLTLALFAGNLLKSPCLRETNYYCIKVSERSPEVRALILDRLALYELDARQTEHAMQTHSQLQLNVISSRCPSLSQLLFGKIFCNKRKRELSMKSKSKHITLLIYMLCLPMRVFSYCVQ